MKTFYEQKFSGIPSIQPLKSPSPDLKNKNSLAFTLSPSYINMRKTVNPLTPTKIKQYNTLPNNQKKYVFQPEYFNQTLLDSTQKKQFISNSIKQATINNRRDQSQCQTTDKKYFQIIDSKSQQLNELKKVINEKDMIINQLKSTINMMTQNGKYLKKSYSQFKQENYQHLKNQVKILTIQNQKLLEVIDRINQKKQLNIQQKQQNQRNQQIASFGRRQQKQNSFIESFFQQKSSFKLHQIKNDRHILKQQKQIIQNYQQQIQKLKNKIKQKQIFYQKQIDELIKLHKSLALQCKMFQGQKQRYSKQNQRLINLLRLKQKQKQTGYGNYSYVDKLSIPYQSDNQKINNIQTNNNKNTQNTRLSIQKIKDQYSQNLKQYKQNIYHEIQNMFQTMTLTLQQINTKLNKYEQKINELQNLKKQYFKKDKNTNQNSNINSHMTSQQYYQEQYEVKSAIYIQQAPSSQRISNSDKRSRQTLSVVLEQSRRDNQKLQSEIIQLKNQLKFYQQKVSQKYQQNQLNNSTKSQNNNYNLGQKINQLELQLQNKKNQQIQLKQTIQQYKNIFQNKQKQLLNENQKLKVIIQQKQRNLNLQRQSHNCKILKNQQINQLLNQQITIFRRENYELKEKIKQIKQLSQKQQQSNFNLLRSMQEKFAIQTTKLHQLVNQIQAQNKQVYNQNQRLNQQCVQKTQKLQQLQRCLQTYQNILMNDDSIQNILKYISFLQKYFQSLEKDQNQVSQQKSKFDEYLMRLNQQNLLLKEQTKYLKASIQVYQKQSSERKKYFQSLINGNFKTSQNSRIKNIKQDQFQNMKKKVDGAKSRIQNLINFQRKKTKQMTRIIQLQAQQMNN